MVLKAKFFGNTVSDVLVRLQITFMPSMWKNLSFIIIQGSVQFTSCQLSILFALDCSLENPHIILRQQAKLSGSDCMNCMVSSVGTVWYVLQIDLSDICIVKPQEIWLSFMQIKMSQFWEAGFFQCFLIFFTVGKYKLVFWRWVTQEWKTNSGVLTLTAQLELCLPELPHGNFAVDFIWTKIWCNGYLVTFGLLWCGTADMQQPALLLLPCAMRRRSVSHGLSPGLIDGNRRTAMGVEHLSLLKQFLQCGWAWGTILWLVEMCGLAWVWRKVLDLPKSLAGDSWIKKLEWVVDCEEGNHGGVLQSSSDLSGLLPLCKRGTG